MTRQAIIVGAGIIGLSTAICLKRLNFSVTLIDRENVPRGASWGNAGHVAVEQVEPLASMRTALTLPTRLFSRGGALALPPRDIGRWLPFSLRAIAAARPARFAAGRDALAALLAEAMPAWRRLDAFPGRTPLLIGDGHFILWESAATAAAGRTAWVDGDCGTARFRDADPGELAQLRHLTRAPVAGAVRCIGSGRIADPTRLADDLRAQFTGSGGRILHAEVTGLPRQGARARVRLADGRRLDADHVVIAAGVASGRLMEQLGHRAPIIAERGYHIESPVAEADWPMTTPPLVFEDRSMIVTRFERRLRAASFVEFSSLSAPADPRKWRRLRSHAAEAGLPIAPEGGEWIGARPTFPDYLPAIGASDRAVNLLYAFGHQHLGLTLGPVTGEIVAALATGATPPVSVDAFSLARFRG